MTRPRLREDGSYEIRSRCPLCGRNTLDRNSRSGLFHCWACSYRGSASNAQQGPSQPLGSLPTLGATQTSSPLVRVDPSANYAVLERFPPFAEAAIAARGLDPTLTIRDYGLVWDGRRIGWPTGRGYAWRHPLRGVEPKVRTEGPKGLIGFPRLDYGQALVLVEGDYKAASIPRPWIGLGIQGTGPLTDWQRDTLLVHRPASVTIWLDYGCQKKASEILTDFWMLEARVVHQPIAGGPDDLPLSTRMELLRRHDGTRD